MAKKTKELTLEEKLEQALVPVEEQPYELPENWCWVRQDKVCNLADGEKRTDEEHPYLEVKYLRGAKTADYVTKGKYIIEGSKVILVDGENSGEVFSIFESGYMGSTFKQLLISDKLNADYIKFFIDTKKEYYKNNKKGSAIPHLNKKLFREMPFPLPPLAEQQRIVDRIESLFAKLDEAKDKLETVLEESTQRKEAFLHELFVGNLTDRWRAQNKVNKDKTWKYIELKNCGEWSGGGTPSTSKTEYWDNGNIMWITSKDMKSDVIEDTQMHVNMVGIENSSAKYCNSPAVLFVMRSGILRRTLPISMVNKEFCVNQDLKFIVPNAVETDYLFWVCKAFEKDILNKCKKDGTTVESIEAKKLLSYKIPVPSEDERNMIVANAEAFSNREDKISEMIENEIELIETMKKSILAKAFRGKLGTNDPLEKSATEFLKQVME